MGQVADTARRVAAGEVSPVELVEGVLDRIERWEPAVNSLSHVHAEQALEEAAARAAEVAAGGPLGPLHGVPVAVKDLYDVTGWETTGCSSAYRGNMATADAEVVRRLREAGAVIVAKNNQHELAAGATNVVSSRGPSRNPWNPARMTGGSSGGSAASVAARIVPVSIGSDTGGSIRIPASFCGVAGLKPTWGSVSMRGAMALAPSLDTAGPLALTVADVAAVHEVLADRPGLAAEGALPPAGLRLGLEHGFFAERVHPEVRRVLEAAVATFEQAGVAIGPVHAGHLADAPEMWTRIAWAEFAVSHGHLLRRPDMLYGPTRKFLQQGMDTSAVDFIRATARVGEIRRGFDEALRNVDAILAPTTPFPAPPLEAQRIVLDDGTVMDVSKGGISWFTRPVSLAGLPALSVPGGFTSDGLPIGLQLIGRPGGEAALLRMGTAFEEATGHHQRAPSPPVGTIA
jgi:Asp-tRNA(Asn)/Glu-tRNA(Gln) amidotransferase A subunit family amidase